MAELRLVLSWMYIFIVSIFFPLRPVIMNISTFFFLVILNNMNEPKCSETIIICAYNTYTKCILCIYMCVLHLAFNIFAHSHSIITHGRLVCNAIFFIFSVVALYLVENINWKSQRTWTAKWESKTRSSRATKHSSAIWAEKIHEIEKLRKEKNSKHSMIIKPFHLSAVRQKITNTA